MIEALYRLFVPVAYAVEATPTVIPVPEAANQTLVNIFASIQAAIYGLIPVILQYALPLMLLFLAIGLGMALFNRFRH
jgi:hypothetical protein